jgi:hypothetical protein
MLFLTYCRHSRRPTYIAANDGPCHSATISTYTGFIRTIVVATTVVIIASAMMIVPAPTIVTAIIATGISVHFSTNGIAYNGSHGGTTSIIP